MLYQFIVAAIARPRELNRYVSFLNQNRRRRAADVPRGSRVRLLRDAFGCRIVLKGNHRLRRYRHRTGQIWRMVARRQILEGRIFANDLFVHRQSPK